LLNLYYIKGSFIEIPSESVKREYKKEVKTVKKLIILLMAVSMMLTSCGKLTGLLNGNKKAENNSFADTKESLDTKGKKPRIDTIKRYFYTATNFVYNHYILCTAALAVAGIVINFGVKVWSYRNVTFDNPYKHPPLPGSNPTFTIHSCFGVASIIEEFNDKGTHPDWKAIIKPQLQIFGVKFDTSGNALPAFKFSFLRALSILEFNLLQIIPF
jgi:hypothetical protein